RPRSDRLWRSGPNRGGTDPAPSAHGRARLCPDPAARCAARLAPSRPEPDRRRARRGTARRSGDPTGEILTIRGVCTLSTAAIGSHIKGRFCSPHFRTRRGIARMQLKDPQLVRQKCYVDGAWVEAEAGKPVKVVNPATGEVLGTIPNMGAKETRRAIA